MTCVVWPPGAAEKKKLSRLNDRLLRGRARAATHLRPRLPRGVRASGAPLTSSAARARSCALGPRAATLQVVSTPTSKATIKDVGSVPDFLKYMQENGIFGEQTWYGNTKSEGGFAENTVSVVNVISLDSTEKEGKTYYKYHLLTRTADGDEGGRHLLISATVSGGKIWLCKAVAGDKRFFKGEDKFVEGTWDSFTVA